MAFTSFTITQPFLGAPLNFVPALGSPELEQLVDAYVLGYASKQDKLSEVTIDFYNHATVDLNTGALVKTYNVFAFEQSPSESQSSFSPSMYTPSPSASMSFADSAYGSLSMTLPARKSGGRVSKKPTKKDAKKAAEARLPGFSIMTKDGIDVTSTAGRGTKTKEQREHAHLMRIMKACDACKKKKIRCDPSHSRQSNEMSRSSTNSTAQTGCSSSRVNPSPTISIPSLSHESSIPSQSNTPSYGAIDDFVLFPEDGSSWNPADMSVPEDADLSQFNFDINLDIPMNSGDFDFSNFDSLQPVDFNQLSYLPATPQLGIDQWAGLPGPHSRPHPSSSTVDAGQLDVNSQDSWVDALTDSIYNRRTHPSSFTPESGESSIYPTTNVSPQTVGTPADNIWPDGPGDALSLSQSVESLYDHHLNSQDSRSTPPRSDSHAVLLPGDDTRYGLSSYEDAYEGAFASGVGSGPAVPAIQDTPSSPLLIMQVDRFMKNTEIVSGMPTSGDDQEQQARGYLNSVFQMDIADRQRDADRTQPSRVSRSHLTYPTDPAQAEQHGAASSLQYVEGSRDESRPEGHDAYSRGSIPRTTVSSEGIVAAAPVLDTVLHYSTGIMTLVFAAMAAAFVASITRISSSMLLSLFIPVAALLLSTPRQVQLAALSCIAVLTVSNTGLFKEVPKGCREWTEGSSLASIARVAVIAALVAIPPSSSGVAKMLSLLRGSHKDCCGAYLEVDSPSV
ncbi:hypothetical protein LOCC1_G006516 [Lachnellula occidentalis]|uniref:Uncharacterized protein n=1 Tax=Lachnellula occidentalis TaxID=215460 RepID=A0A8H8RVQ5_9HELO|nr:hypothetical protein LOCC1_G006516 [Lachnellula occidentalis]